MGSTVTSGKWACPLTRIAAYWYSMENPSPIKYPMIPEWLQIGDDEIYSIEYSSIASPTLCGAGMPQHVLLDKASKT